MSQMMETMESRTLFTASAGVILADLDAIKATGVAAKADLNAALNTAKADTKTLKAAVLATHPTAAEKAPFNKVLKDETIATVKFKAKITTILSAGTRSGDHLLAALKSLKAHPTSIVLKAKVQADLALLQGIFSSTVVSTVEANAAATVSNLDADLNAVATAAPSTQTDVNSFELHLAADQTTLSTQATAIQAAIAHLATDLA